MNSNRLLDKPHLFQTTNAVLNGHSFAGYFLVIRFLFNRQLIGLSFGRPFPFVWNTDPLSAVIRRKTLKAQINPTLLVCKPMHFWWKLFFQHEVVVDRAIIQLADV